MSYEHKFERPEVGDFVKLAGMSRWCVVSDIANNSLTVTVLIEGVPTTWPLHVLRSFFLVKRGEQEGTYR